MYFTIISGRFCGHDGERFISTGSSLLLVFQSGPGGPSWDYSGFELNVADRWRGEYYTSKCRTDKSPQFDRLHVSNHTTGEYSGV